jgi:ketosteroid isomerase-like protein
MPTREFFVELYEAFNRREIERVLAAMAPDVKWANGMEGGFEYGRDAVREYWMRQFQMVDSRVEPTEIEIDGNRAVVTAHQRVRDLEGNLLLDTYVRHVFTIEDGLISKFEIEEIEKGE